MISLLNHMPFVPTCLSSLRNYMLNVPTFLYTLRTYVPSCLRVLIDFVPTCLRVLYFCVPLRLNILNNVLTCPLLLRPEVPRITCLCAHSFYVPTCFNT